MDQLVLAYLFQSGRKDVALAFQEESSLNNNEEHGFIPSALRDTLEIRSVIMDSILKGDVRAAISKINDVDARILHDNPSYAFALHKLTLLDLFDQRKTIEALKYAQIQMAPLVKSKV